ncbi:ABC transporter ATP-binding protein [Lysinibacillus fusiformis]
MFKVDNLAVRLSGKSLIQGLTFTVPKGHITAIIGESGSGKSTTLSALLGMLPARASMEGSILFNENNLMVPCLNRSVWSCGKSISLPFFRMPRIVFHQLKK